MFSIKKKSKKDNKKLHKKKMMSLKKWNKRRQTISLLRLKIKIYSELIKRKLILIFMIRLIEHHISKNINSSYLEELKKLINQDINR
jgi:hypothetical protein